MGAKASGGCPIIGIDRNPHKLELAKKLGATHVLNTRELDNDQIIEEVKKITGYGVDHSMVATAGIGIKKVMLNATAQWGQLVVIGHGHPRDEVAKDITYMNFLRGKRITGCVMGGITLRRDVPKYMEMYRNGQIDIDALFTHRFTLDQIVEALDDSRHGALKNVVYIGCPIPEDLSCRP